MRCPIKPWKDVRAAGRGSVYWTTPVFSPKARSVLFRSVGVPWSECRQTGRSEQPCSTGCACTRARGLAFGQQSPDLPWNSSTDLKPSVFLISYVFAFFSSKAVSGSIFFSKFFKFFVDLSIHAWKWKNCLDAVFILRVTQAASPLCRARSAASWADVLWSWLIFPSY